MRIGFIGLGDQGGAMAGALLKGGNELTIWARRPGSAAHLLDAGVCWAEDAAAVAHDTDIVALCVTDEAAVRQVLFDRGLLASMKRGQLLAIHATIAPDAIAEMALQAQDHGIGFLDAPVSGSGNAVMRGSLLMLLGGDADAAHRLGTCYSSFCNPVFHVGPVGAATRLKLINNLKCAVDYGLTGRINAMAAREGIDPALAREALLSGTGRSFALEALTRIAREGRADHVANILEKDVRLALAAFSYLPTEWPVLADEGIAVLRAAEPNSGMSATAKASMDSALSGEETAR